MTQYEATKLQNTIEAARDEWLHDKELTAQVNDKPTYTNSDDAWDGDKMWSDDLLWEQ